MTWYMYVHDTPHDIHHISSYVVVATSSSDGGGGERGTSGGGSSMEMAAASRDGTRWQRMEMKETRRTREKVSSQLDEL